MDRCLPLVQFPFDARRRLRGVFTDIDDTLTSDGRLTAAAYGALERLHRAGLIVIPVTGRPAGWCDHIARMWPVDAVVGENGAFYFWYDRCTRRLCRNFERAPRQRAEDRRRLEALRERILAAVPGAGIASDQDYRVADLAVDFSEDVPALGRADIDRIVSLFEAEGATAKVSSIHVNGWFGSWDKLSTTRSLMRQRFDIDLDAERDAFVFIGDSPNDAPMFAYFSHAIGVANIHDMADRLPAWPRYVTAARSGTGFVEAVDAILAAR